jgi:membrane complex biogenesis BtpA family protein
MRFTSLFPVKKPLIGCLHLLPLPGAPRYQGDMADIYRHALEELEIFKQHKLDGVIIENFRDKPFFPSRVPAETIAALAAVGREIVKAADMPVGINVLRNDAESAIAIATAIEAQFIRVNVHMNAVVSEQGIIEGLSHLTVRLRTNLRSEVLIFADVGVKHAAPLASRGLVIETKDLTERGLADAIIVSGELTGSETNADDVEIVKRNTSAPVLIGSGTTPENIHKIYERADGFIVGSYFKSDGIGNNLVDPERVSAFCSKLEGLRHQKVQRVRR